MPAPKSSEPVPAAARQVKPAPGRGVVESATTSQPQTENHAKAQSPKSQPDLVLTAALEPAPSWIAAHKFVLLALLGIGAGVAVVLLR
jgi:hypothetical protein